MLYEEVELGMEISDREKGKYLTNIFYSNWTLEIYLRLKFYSLACISAEASPFLRR